MGLYVYSGIQGRGPLRTFMLHYNKSDPKFNNEIFDKNM